MMPMFTKQTGRIITNLQFTLSGRECGFICARNEGLIGMMGLL